MFTGIIECTGLVSGITTDQGNLDFIISSEISKELKMDQSVSHDGVCLTVTHVDKENSRHQVTAIAETLEKTNIGGWKIGDIVNLERCTKLGDRLDGHIVQGHVDQVAICTDIEDKSGSKIFSFKYEGGNNVTVEKGSITVNGTSLTVVNSKNNGFSVAIIPYTLENTKFKTLEVGDTVNVEFDIIGKYIQKFVSEKVGKKVGG